MPHSLGLHPAEESLERYAMGFSSDDTVASLEEHLLICEHCQGRLDAAHAYVAIAREATRQLEEARISAPPRNAWLQSIARWFSMRPSGALLAACAVLLAVFVGFRPGQAPAPKDWQTVTLEAWRGGEAERSIAEAGYSLSLRLSAQGLPEADLLAEIVDTAGTVVANATARPASGWVMVRHSAGLPAGGYWVRLSQGNKPLREYALVVKSSGN